MANKWSDGTLTDDDKRPLERNCARIQKNALVSARIAEIKRTTSENAMEALQVSKAWVLEQGREVFDRAMAHVPVRVKGGKGYETIVEPCPKCDEMIPIGVYQADLRTACRQIELFGRYTGLEEAGKHLSDASPDPFEHMGPDEICDYVIALVRELGMEERVLEALSARSENPGSGEGFGPTERSEAPALPALSQAN